MPNSKNVLVCPLDWGMGHATRMVPVIDLLIKSGAKIFIGADKRPMAYLMQRFPGCSFIQLPGYSVNYPESGSMALSMIKAYPEMVAASKKAKQLLKKIITNNKIDIVFSDNRYELSSDQAYSVFITHQLNIQTPGLTVVGKPFINKKIYNFIRKFDELWIPDFEKEPSLSGVLSHVQKMPLNNFHFIGPLSRFSLVKPITPVETLDLLILLSGPEPQRTILEQKLIEQALAIDLKTVVLQGKPEDKDSFEVDKIKLVSHLPDEEIAGLISKAKHIVCRPGYSSIMDLAVFGKKAIFIPTPGQTEQEYLAKRFREKGICYSTKQQSINLDAALIESVRYSGFQSSSGLKNLEKRITDLLSK